MNETKNQTSFEIKQVINQPYKYGFETKIEKKYFLLELAKKSLNLFQQKKRNQPFANFD
jgi:hypothetical protein